MRLVSNKESVARGEVSILAIVETLLAIALVFYLSAHFNTLRWLAVAICVSPLLLLRTEESTRLAIEWSDYCIFILVRNVSKRWRVRLREVSRGLATVVAIPLVRTTATLVATIRDPLAAIRSIPANWLRITLATDSRQAPEPIQDHPYFTLKNISLGGIGYLRGVELVFSIIFGVLVVFILLFLPALLYRWALKSTSIIYAPLVFVAHSTFSEGADLRTKLELIKRGDLSRIRVWYGVITIAAFLVKLVLMMNLPGFADWWNRHPISQFLALYVAPAEIPKWQLAELANSALAIGAMLFARHALLRDELKHPLPEAPAKLLLGFVSGLRWVLALYAILCTGYITMRAAQHWHWPALGEQWLPW